MWFLSSRGSTSLENSPLHWGVAVVVCLLCASDYSSPESCVSHCAGCWLRMKDECRQGHPFELTWGIANNRLLCATLTYCHLETIWFLKSLTRWFAFCTGSSSSSLLDSCCCTSSGTAWLAPHSKSRSSTRWDCDSSSCEAFAAWKLWTVASERDQNHANKLPFCASFERCRTPSPSPRRCRHLRTAE